MQSADWTAGYVADVAYTYGYYGELNPLRAELALLNRALAPPVIENACELGFGQGMSVNVHAASSDITWWGTDFNPGQAAFAQDLARASQAPAHLFDDAFLDFSQRPDLPDFDYISLHGIWSWVSDENRSVIVDFIRRKLKPGGVVYISYNTLPGFAAFAPIRRLFIDHAREMSGSGGGTLQKIDAALGFVDRLMSAQPGLLRAIPSIAPRLDKLKAQDRHYLAHEYFNRDWRPMYVTEAAELLERAKLSYAGSAHLLDHVDVVNLTAEQQAVLTEVPEGIFRELARDFMVNQQFRRDYWVKGARRLTSLERAERMEALRVALVTPAADVAMKVNGALGDASLNEEVYRPLLDVLADHRPRTLPEIRAAMRGRTTGLAELQEAAVLLTGAGHLAIAQDEGRAKRAQPAAGRLNARLQELARSRPEMQVLASPVIGGGIPANRFEILFAEAVCAGAKTPAEWAEHVLQLLAAQGQALLKDGVALQSPEANRAELLAQAQSFAEKKLPILEALGAAS